MFPIVDTHCHLDIKDFDPDIEIVIENAKKAGLVGIIVPCIDVSGITKVLEICESYDFIYAAVGIHPNSESSIAQIDIVRDYVQHPKVVAIGEIGLDQYRQVTSIDYQTELFRKQLEIALDCSLPVIIHTRCALKTAMEIIRTHYQSSSRGVVNHRGVFHAFEGSSDDAEELRSLGFYIGIGGPITYPKASEKKNLIKCHVLSNILLETDAPFLPPQNHRGRRNEPAYLKDICDKIAEVRGESYKRVAEVTTSSAISLFQIGDFH